MSNKKQGVLAAMFVTVVVISAFVFAVVYVARTNNDQKTLDNVQEVTSLTDLPLSKGGMEEKLIELTNQAYWTCGDRLSPASITDILVVPVRTVGIETVREYQIQVLGSEQVVAVLTVVEIPMMNSAGGQTIVPYWSCTGPK